MIYHNRIKVINTLNIVLTFFILFSGCNPFKGDPELNIQRKEMMSDNLPYPSYNEKNIILKHRWKWKENEVNATGGLSSIFFDGKTVYGAKDDKIFILREVNEKPILKKITKNGQIVKVIDVCGGNGKQKIISWFYKNSGYKKAQLSYWHESTGKIDEIKTEEPVDKCRFLKSINTIIYISQSGFLRMINNNGEDIVLIKQYCSNLAISTSEQKALVSCWDKQHSSEIKEININDKFSYKSLYLKQYPDVGIPIGFGINDDIFLYHPDMFNTLGHIDLGDIVKIDKQNRKKVILSRGGYESFVFGENIFISSEGKGYRVLDWLVYEEHI